VKNRIGLENLWTFLLLLFRFVHGKDRTMILSFWL